jgi:hypothetical protein
MVGKNRNENVFAELISSLKIIKERMSEHEDTQIGTFQTALQTEKYKKITLIRMTKYQEQYS